MLKKNIIATLLYIFVSICFFESCIECPVFGGTTMIGFLLILIVFTFFFLNSLVLFVGDIKENSSKNLSNLIFQPLLAIFCIFLGSHTIDFINYLNLNWKYEAMFKFRKMDWDDKINCENNICDVPKDLVCKLGKYVAKNGPEYIFPKIPIGGYNAFVIANDYNLVYEKYNYFNTTFSDYVYIINYDIKPPQKN